MERDKMKRRVKTLFVAAMTGFSVLVGIFPSLADENSEWTVPVTAIRVSGNTGQYTPGSSLTDNDAETAWGLAEGEQEGWAELTMAGDTIVDGVVISCAMSPETSLSIEYEQDGVWYPFAGATVKGLCGDGHFIDLSFDRIVTGRLALRMNGPSPGGDRIYEVGVRGRDADDILHKIPIADIISEDNTSWFNPESNLIDGNLYTTWATRSWMNCPDDMAKAGSFLEKHHHRWKHRKSFSPYESEAVLDLGGEYSLDEISLYFDRDSWGDVIVSVKKGGEWEEVDYFPHGRDEGWYHTELDPESDICSEVKLKVKGSSWVLGGIAEVEVWGYGNYTGDAAFPAGISGPAALDTPLNGIFNIDRCKAYDIEVVAEGACCNPLTVELNGYAMTREPLAPVTGNTVYRYETEAQDFWEGENFLRIRPLEGGAVFISASLKERRERGDRKVCSEPVNDDLLFTPTIYEPERVYDFGEAVSLKQVEVYAIEPFSMFIYGRENGEWKMLSVKESRDGITVFEGDRMYADGLKIENDGIEGPGEIVVLGSPTKDKAPGIKIIWPSHGEEIPYFQVMSGLLVGSIDNNRAEVEVNGVKPVVNGNFFWLPLKKLGLTEGDIYEITAEAVDGQGRADEHTVIVTVGLPVRFTIDQPDEIIYTDEDEIEISGRVFSERLSVTVNGEEADREGKRFSKTVSLEDGLNIVTIQFIHEGKTKQKPFKGGKKYRDKEKILKTLFRKVVKLSGDMAISIDYPYNDSYLADDTVAVRGTVSGSVDVEVRVNGEEASVEGTAYTSVPIILSEGKNIITVTARDGCGHECVKSVTVFRDTVKPAVNDVQPPDGFISPVQTITVTGTIAETSPVWVYVNGNLAAIDGETFSIPIGFEDGVWPVMIEAVDAAGNESETYIFDIMVDTVPPEPFEVTAAPDGWTNNRQPVISFETTDTLSGIDRYELAMDGGPFAVAESPCTLPEQEDGEHTVTVIAYDRAGWPRTGTASVYIDTVVPETPHGFNLVPGNGSIIVEWEQDDEDVVSFTVERDPEWDNGEVMTIGEKEYKDTGLTNASYYRYRVSAVDRAGNTSEPTEWKRVICGLEAETYRPETTTVVEYDGAVVYIPKGGLSGDANIITIGEVENEAIEETAYDPVVSPMYEFLILDGDREDATNDVTFEEYFVGCIRYDESMIPEGLTEEDLGVYYYDPMWDRWFMIDFCGIDKENNVIYFTTNHFSKFTVQATPVNDLSPDEYKDTGYSPFKTYVQHESLVVSPQGGGVSTNVTELVLPGPAGFDLVLKRRYDLSTAKIDAAYFVNLDRDIPKLRSRLRNTGDYAYCMGKGWRLALPYVRNANREEQICLPDGGIHSFWSLECKTNTAKKDIVLEHHGHYDFRLVVLRKEIITTTQTMIYPPSDTVEPYMDVKEERSWRTDGYILTMKDGTEYTMDAGGRTVKITEPAGINEISIIYKTDTETTPEIEYIEDKIGRSISFEYAEKGDGDAEWKWKYISKIKIDGDSYGREIAYTQDKIGLLLEAVDAGGRVWEYEHDEKILDNTSQIPIELEESIEMSEQSSVIALLDNLTARRKTHTVRPIKRITGPGKGDITIHHVKKDIDNKDRLMADTITVMKKAADGTEIIYTTNYNYTFEKIKKKKGDEHVITSTIQTDGPRRTRYYYNTLEEELYRWKMRENYQGNDVIDKSLSDRRSQIHTRIKKIIKEDIPGEILEVEDTEYQVSGNKFLPNKKTVSHGTQNKREATYAYDGWGNVIYMQENSEAGGRKNKSTVYRKYIGTGAEILFDENWKSYAWEVISHNVGKHKDLILAEMKANYLPAYNDGVPTDDIDELNPQYQYTYYNYNRRGQITGKAQWDECGGEGQWIKTGFDYYDEDAFGNLRTKTDPEGHVTEYAYDEHGYLSRISELNVSGQNGDLNTLSDYEDDSGWLSNRTNPRGFTTSYTYDSLGRIKTITEPKDSNEATAPVTTINYCDDKDDLFAEVTDQCSRKTKYEYNDLGQLSRIIKNPGGSDTSITTLTYNRWREIESITDPNSHTTKYTYDALGRRESIIYPDKTAQNEDNPIKTMKFDYTSNILTITDEESNITKELNDMYGRVIKRIQYNAGETIETRFYFDGEGNRIAQTGPREGEVIRNKYNTLNQLVQMTMPEVEIHENGETGTSSLVTRSSYNGAGYKVEEMITGPLGVTREAIYTVDELGRVLETYNREGTNEIRIQKTAYDKNGNKTRVEDALGNAVTYTYSERDKMLTETDAEGNTTSYTYYKDGTIASMTGPRGNSGNYPGRDFTIIYHYDDFNRLERAEIPEKIEGEGKPEIRFYYDPRGNLDRQSNPDGSEIAYAYSPRNLVETETESGDGKTYTTRYGYDRRGNLVSTTDRRGFTTINEYEALGRLIKTIYPEGNFERFAYDKKGNRKTITDGNGNKTEYAYDLMDRISRITYPGGNIVDYTYDRLGNKTYETNSLEQERRYTYDWMNRLKTETDAVRNTYRYEYDDAGNITGTEDPNGTVSVYEYDDNYRITAITMSNVLNGTGKTIEYAYDEVGTVIMKRDDNTATYYNGYETGTYRPDPYDRIMSETKNIGGKTLTVRYDYDVMDRITGLTYPGGTHIGYTYNRHGEMTAMPGYIDQAPVYEGGLVKSLTAANSVETTWEYDMNGRLTELSHNKTTETINVYEFDYDNANNIIKRNADIYSYDEENRLLTADLTGSFGIDMKNRTQRVGNIEDDFTGEKSLSFTGEETELILDYSAMSIGVDLKGTFQISKVEIRTNELSNRIKERTLEIFTSLSNWEGDYEKAEGWDYAETADGIIEIRFMNPVETRYIKVHCYFDDRDEDEQPVDRATIRNTRQEIIKVYYMADWRFENYGYDVKGNRLSSSINLEDEESESSGYRYYEKTDRLKTNGRYAYIWDNNGNLTGKGDHIILNGETIAVSEVENSDWDVITDSVNGLTIAHEGIFFEYTYDLLNRVTEVKKNGETKAEYLYDESGLMVKKTGNKETIYYAYSMNGKLLYEENEDTFKYRRYMYVFGKHFAREDGSVGSDDVTRYYYHTDHLGSVTAVTDETGKILWQNDYTPFGELADQYNTYDGAQVYAGYFWDEDAELYYAKARWYDAETGRFTTVDPVKDGVNWYVYVRNNPMGYVDESGLAPGPYVLPGSSLFKNENKIYSDQIMEATGKATLGALKVGAGVILGVVGGVLVVGSGVITVGGAAVGDDSLTPMIASGIALGGVTIAGAGAVVAGSGFKDLGDVLNSMISWMSKWKNKGKKGGPYDPKDKRPPANKPNINGPSQGGPENIPNYDPTSPDFKPPGRNLTPKEKAALIAAALAAIHQCSATSKDENESIDYSEYDYADYYADFSGYNPDGTPIGQKNEGLNEESE